MQEIVGFLLNYLYFVDAYNKKEEADAKHERRNAIFLPHISAHNLRHTGCTRMAKAGMDPKALQYVMGHADISMTMSVYNHVSGLDRIAREMTKMDEAVSF